MEPFWKEPWLMILRMKDQNVYYCWFCDAHRVAAGSPQKPCCPRCGHELPADAQLDSPLQLASGGDNKKRPAFDRALLNRA
jgi:uncharacterized paraquat-inducible protein A